MVAQQADIYQDFADFIAGLSPEKLLDYYAPPKMQKWVELLLERKREGKITAAEAAVMERYFMLAHIVRLAKARALKIMKDKQTQ